MLEKDSKWLDHDYIKTNQPKMEQSLELQPILAHIENISPVEIPNYNKIKFMFEKILLDKGLEPGVHNFDWV